MFDADVNNTGMKKTRKERQKYQEWKKGYYHMSTDGWKEGLLFNTVSQYVYGMIVVGLLTLRYNIKIYSFSLMSNHIHILLSGTGRECVEAFGYLRRKLSARLIRDGFPPPPEDYWFKLVRIETPEQMRNNFIYIDRNAYEKLLCVPTAYPWSCAYLHFSLLGEFITGKRADSFSCRELERITGTRTPIPAHWQFHPTLGLLPVSFVDNSLFSRLFRSPKEYEIRVVKDYEAYVKVAESLDECPDYTPEEMTDIVNTIIRNQFRRQEIKQLTNEEKAKLVVRLVSDYKFTTLQAASVISQPEYIVKQFLRSKDYGLR